jgi:hypothetical protein
MGQSFNEKDAGEKWCPEARVSVIVEMPNGVMNAAQVNRQPRDRDPYRGAHCVASICAHWQWMPGQRGKDRKGYCGLSAKPET